MHKSTGVNPVGAGRREATRRPVDENERVPQQLPSGVVTFMFTDVEGSTKLLHELGADAYARTLTEHRRLVRDAVARHGGVEVDTQGDAFFVAFAAAGEAIAAARAVQAALAPTRVRVRMGLHTGTPRLTEEGYVGADVHLGARIAAAAHGGQVLLSQATRDLVGGDLTDLGEHRVKDFAEPVWLFQLGDERFPPLKTISNTNLPRPASSFVGRERELGEVTALLRGGARLVTLRGPGGSGKTRLAIETAAELVPEYRNGVFWIELAAIRDPALVAPAIGQTLGTTDALADHVGERELLLLLDNFEQVVEAAPELASLVESCPNLRLLVTSRELLRVRGEVEYAVPPLTEPEAVELFCARSGLDRDAAIAELCRRLDSLPLAVELAAARTSVLSPSQILERLSRRLDLLNGGRDAQARQQTLRATIEWSYELLDEDEQRLFARLAVFRGGCTLEAALAVCAADLDTLQALVDKSLLRHTGERFWMLETIREYATERLAASSEADELSARFVGYFVALAEDAWPFVRESSGEWLDLLERELDNLRAALDALEASDETQRLLSVLGATGNFWAERFHSREALARLVRALAADQAPTTARARALSAAALIAVECDHGELAKPFAEEALKLSRELGDDWGAAYALLALGFSDIYADWARARDRFAESAARFRAVGDQWQILEATRYLAWAYERLGDRERARRIHEDRLEQARRAGNRYSEARTLSTLSRYAIHDGRLDEALALAPQALEGHLEVGNRWGVVLDFSTFARLRALQGDPEAAARLLGCVERQEEELEFSEPWLTDFNRETQALLRDELGEAALAEATGAGRRLTIDEAVAVALAASPARRIRAASPQL